MFATDTRVIVVRSRARGGSRRAPAPRASRACAHPSMRRPRGPGQVSPCEHRPGLRDRPDRRPWQQSRRSSRRRGRTRLGERLAQHPLVPEAESAGHAGRRDAHDGAPLDALRSAAPDVRIPSRSLLSGLRQRSRPRATAPSSSRARGCPAGRRGGGRPCRRAGRRPASPTSARCPRPSVWRPVHEAPPRAGARRARAPWCTGWIVGVLARLEDASRRIRGAGQLEARRADDRLHLASLGAMAAALGPLGQQARRRRPTLS